MTQNVYLGANLVPLFSGGDFATAAQQVLMAVTVTDFPARSKGIAAEITAQQPDVVGLQEVALWETGLWTGTACVGLSASNPGGIDFLTTLLARLSADGMSYTAASIAPEFTATAPVGSGCVRYTQRDVILVRSDKPGLSYTNPLHHQYGDFGTPTSPTELTVTIPVLPAPIPIHRGWASVDVTVNHKAFRFIDTHLEAYSTDLRDVQANLLVQHAITTSPLPVVAVGDVNSGPNYFAGAYDILTSALTDAWPVVANKGDEGFTSGQLDQAPYYLRSTPSAIDHRIDMILFSRPSAQAKPHSGVVVGDAESDMVPPSPGDLVPGNLWPSDHAGVVATLHLAKP